MTLGSFHNKTKNKDIIKGLIKDLYKLPLCENNKTAPMIPLYKEINNKTKKLEPVRKNIITVLAEASKNQTKPENVISKSKLAWYFSQSDLVQFSILI